MPLKQGDIKAGEGVSGDQFKSRITGGLVPTKGLEYQNNNSLVVRCL